LIAGTAGGTKRRRESAHRRKPSQRVKPEAKAEEGSLAAPETKRRRKSEVVKLVDPEDARTGGRGILIDGSAGDATFARN